MKKMQVWMGLCAVLLLFPAAAQPLADQVPADAIAYMGWRGTTDLGPAYDGSNMQGVMEATGFFDAIPELMDAYAIFSDTFADEMPEDEAQALDAVWALVHSTWSRGGAIYILGPDEAGPPIPGFVMLLPRGGEGEPEAREAIASLVDLINQAEQVPAFMGDRDDVMFLSIGVDAAELDGPVLAEDDAFIHAITQVQSDAALTLYANSRVLVELIDQFVQAQQEQAAEWGGEPDPFTAAWPTLRDVSGLAGVRQVVLTAGIEDRLWSTQIFMDAPAPRAGFLSLIDHAPIQPEHLTHIPQTVTHLQAGTLDPTRVLEVTRNVLEAVDPALVEQLDGAMAWASEEVGIDLETQMLGSFGSHWSFYVDPMIAGNSLSSMVIVNQLRDAQAMTTALTQLGDLANDAMDGALDGGEAPFTIRFNRREIQGQTIVSLGIPYLSPSWMVYEDKLYFALYPQALEMALEHSGEAQDSILSNTAFQETMARFGEVAPTSLSFTDLPETAPNGYGMTLLIAQSITGGLEMFSGEPSAFLLPPIGKLLPFIEPAGSVAWVAEDGLHMRSSEPFPGSSLLGPGKGAESSMVVTVPLGVAIVLPALGSAHGAAMHMQEDVQCQQIVMGIMAYAHDHGGQMPEDLIQLEPYLLWGGMAWDEATVSPHSQRALPMPFEFNHWDADRQARFVRENSSYVLVPIAGPLDQVAHPWETIILLQRPDDAGGWRQGIAVGFADGHVEWFHDAGFAEQLLLDQTGMRLNELIEHQVGIAP